MKRALLPLILLAASAGVCLPRASAQGLQPIAMLTCSAPNGPSLVEPVFLFESEYISELGFSFALTDVISDGPAFADFFGGVASQTTYSSCVLGNGGTGLILNDVQFQPPVEIGYGAGVLTVFDPQFTSSLVGSEVTLLYTSITVNGVTYPVGASASGASSLHARSAARFSRHGLTHMLIGEGK